METVSDLPPFCISSASIISSGLAVPGIFCSSLQATVTFSLIHKAFSSSLVISICDKSRLGILGGVKPGMFTYEMKKKIVLPQLLKLKWVI